MFYQGLVSLTRNSIYSIHSSYYSIDLASCISNILIISWLILWPNPAFFWSLFGNCDNLIFANPLSTPHHILPEWYFVIFYSCLSMKLLYVGLLIWLTALNWMNDLWMESFLSLTGTEQFSLIYGILFRWLNEALKSFSSSCYSSCLFSILCSCNQHLYFGLLFL